MSKIELLSLLPPQPSPTPRQLENSRSKIPSNDPRDKRYERMIPNAEERYNEWLETSRRIKSLFRKVYGRSTH